MVCIMEAFSRRIEWRGSVAIFADALYYKSFRRHGKTFCVDSFVLVRCNRTVSAEDCCCGNRVSDRGSSMQYTSNRPLPDEELPRVGLICCLWTTRDNRDWVQLRRFFRPVDVDCGAWRHPQTFILPAT
jgi:hypothetical protein